MATNPINSMEVICKSEVTLGNVARTYFLASDEII